MEKNDPMRNDVLNERDEALAQVAPRVLVEITFELLSTTCAVFFLSRLDTHSCWLYRELAAFLPVQGYTDLAFA